MENQYYRTFIGLPVHVGAGMLQARRELMESLRGERISWVDPEKYHVTIRFIGDTKVTTADKISSFLRTEIKVPHRTRIAFSHPGSFGPRKKPRVIWLGFDQTDMFKLLKCEVDEALEKCGIPGIDQPFNAHLTLGRVRSLKELTRFYSAIERTSEKFNESIWFEKLVFFRSELGLRGPVYTALEEINFSP